MMADQGFSLPCNRIYHVFINFGGEDTRHGFIDHLCEALQRIGVRTVTDDVGFEKGDEVSQSLINSIEESRIFIAIFSENYAYSTWCLNELVKIMECVKVKDRFVLPVFYDVDPLNVRHLRGGYGQALGKHLEKFKYSGENVLLWAKALQEAANVSGFNFNSRYESESELIGKIVEVIFSKVSRFPLHVANHPVGLEPQLLELRSLLDVGSACEVKMVGICGLGGIGKTTLAKALYNEIACQFEDLSFLHDIRENSNRYGLVWLQERLLSDVLDDKTIKLANINIGISILRNVLSRKKVFLVLDDVDHSEQLQALAGGCAWFGHGSRIILTSRNRHVLDGHGVGTQFDVKQLNPKEALKLFSWNAFRTNAVDPSYLDASHRALLYAKGLPLALEVLGSYLYGKTTHQWKSALAKCERIPASGAIPKILKVSYDNLDQVHKNIFLDIAYFFIGHRLEYVSNLLQSTCGSSLDYVIGGLVDKSLVRIECGVLHMHDLIRDFGRQIFLQQPQSGPFRVSRLTCEDVCCALKENTVTDNIDVISLKHLKKMRNLRVLEFSSFPFDINLLKVVMVDIPFKCLRRMEFRSCELIRELPDLCGAPNMSELHLQDCKNLTKIHHSIGFLDIRSLYLRGCRKLKTFAHAMKLKPLNFSGCSSLQTYPKITLKMKNIREANLLQTIVQELQKSCSDFQSFSTSKGQEGSPTLLSSLTHLDLSECNLFDQALVYLVCFPNLQNLNLGGNNFTILPACMKECFRLSYLSLDDCKYLRKIEGIPPNIELFRATNCTSLTRISSTMLLSQALHAVGNTQFILPGSRIPEWFDHSNWGGSVSFWVRKKFPHIALCFVLHGSDMQHRKFKLKFRIFVNGKYLFDFNYNYILTLGTDHIMLFDLRSQMASNELEEILLDNEWNHVQVSCVDVPSLEGIIVEKEIARYIGVYVYKKLSSMKDIQFANPNSGPRKDNLFWCSGELKPHCNPLLKSQCKFLYMEAFKTPNMNQQHNLGSVAQNNPIRFKTVFEDRSKYSAVYSGAGMEWDIEWFSLLPSLQPLAGANMILNPAVKTMTDFGREKDVKMKKFCKICGRIHLLKCKQTSVKQSKPVAEVSAQSRGTLVEKIHAQVLENSGVLGSLSEEADFNLISMEHCTDHFDSSLEDIAVKAIDASTESEATDLELLIDSETNNESENTKLSYEAMKALQILRDYVTKRFSFLLDPGRSRFLKIILDYLLSLSEEDGISVRMRSVILQLSRSFTLWSGDYDAARVRLELTTADLLKVDKLQVDIEANIKKAEEVDSLKDELGSKLASLQERKRQLEERIRAITEEITELRAKTL